MQKIVIVGGGLSGSLLAINLLRLPYHAAYDITMIDRNPPDLLGTAYSTDKHFHLLNVPAFKMSAFPDKSEDFVNWLGKNGYAYEPGAFVPRNIYKMYIQEILIRQLEQSGEKSRFVTIRDVALDVIPAERALLLESGTKIHFDKLVLALGNFEPTSLNLSDGSYLQHPAYYGSPWKPHLFDNLNKDKKVLIIGTGLTMVDTLLTLAHNGHKGNITALSTHGFIPEFHVKCPSYPIPDLDPKDIGTALEALRFVNMHIKKARRQGISWHAVVDAFRPFVQKIWVHMPIEERIRFMEHLRHIWGVARHRMPPECAERLQQLLKEGFVSISAGRIKSIRSHPTGRFCVTYDERSSKKQLLLEVDTIVNCMGPESNYSRLKDRLVVNLLKRGLIRTDILQLGIDCTPEGIIIGKNGDLSPYFYTIGPPAKGTLWEITSVPEIRAAAMVLAGIVSQTKKDAMQLT